MMDRTIHLNVLSSAMLFKDYRNLPSQFHDVEIVCFDSANRIKLIERMNWNVILDG